VGGRGVNESFDGDDDDGDDDGDDDDDDECGNSVSLCTACHDNAKRESQL
jgi:hypothetical protein